MQLTLVDRKFKQAGTVEVADSLFDRKWNKALVHRLASSHASNARAATRKQKTRAEVHHTTKRLYRQKGVGKARAGMSSSPIRRGGGRAFPASQFENVHKQINRKEFRVGMATLLSQLAREQRLFIAEEIAADEIKTKTVAKLFAEFAQRKKVLFVDCEFDTKFGLSVRNLHRIETIELNRLVSTDLLRADLTVISKRALEEITKIWQ